VVPLLLSAVVLPASARATSPEGGDVEQVIVQLDDGHDAPLVAEAAGATPVTGSSVDEAPVVSLEVDAAGLQELRADPRVASVMTRGTRVELAMAQSVTKVGAAGRHAAGFDGDGKVVAVIDTGVAATFGGSLVGQACFAATQVGTTLQGHCGPAADQETAFDQACFTAGVCDGGEPLDAQAARPCPGAPTSCEHGTAVAAVAARHDIPVGVAPGAGVYAIQVFNPTGTSADLVDLYLALEHIIEMSDAGAFDIAAVNLSVATAATFAGDCRAAMGPDGSAYDFIFGELRSRGIAPVVSSGNDGNTGAIAFPACVPSAISVGSTDLDDDLASFGNRGPGLDLLAPGADEASFGVAIDPMEIPGNSVVTWAGTSFSAPHVAGAFTLLDQEYPLASVDQRTWFLQAAGVPVSEGGRTYRRLMLRPPEEVLLAQRLFPGEAPVAGAALAALGDVDGDGRADVVAHTPGTGPDRISYGGPGWTFTPAPFVANASYLPVVANVTGAAGGPDDIIWYSPSSSDFVWVGDPDRDLASIPTVLAGAWTPSVGDFDGDGWDDVLWYAPGPAADLLWYGGASGPQAVAVDLPGVYSVGVGDFDGEGHDDLLLDGFGVATDALWRGGARGSFTKSAVAMDGTARLVVANLDGDAADDVVLYRAGSAADQIWRGGPAVGTVTGGSGGFASTTIAINTSYSPVAGDLDGDGDDEILWYAVGPTPDPIWFGQPTGLPTARSVSVAGSYLPLIGDVDGQAGEDVVWFRTSSTTAPIWWSYGGP
jgi:hypothetical protein